MYDLVFDNTSILGGGGLQGMEGNMRKHGNEEDMLLHGKHLQCTKGGVLPQLGVDLRVLMAEPMLGRFVICWLSPTRVGIG